MQRGRNLQGGQRILHGDQTTHLGDPGITVQMHQALEAVSAAHLPTEKAKARRKGRESGALSLCHDASDRQCPTCPNSLPCATVDIGHTTASHGNHRKGSRPCGGDQKGVSGSKQYPPINSRGFGEVRLHGGEASYPGVAQGDCVSGKGPKVGGGARRRVHMKDALQTWERQLLGYDSRQQQYADAITKAKKDMDTAHRQIQTLNARAAGKPRPVQPTRTDLELRAPPSEEDAEERSLRRQLHNALAKCPLQLGSASHKEDKDSKAPVIDVDGVEKFDLTEQDDPQRTRPKPQNAYDPPRHPSSLERHQLANLAHRKWPRNLW